MRPSFACRPERVVGMPVALAILRLKLVTPSARFQENDRPGPSFMASPYFGQDFAGAGCEDRTRHLMITSQALYQLS